MDKKVLTLILPFILFAIIIPLFIDFFIFGNSIPSNISNETWAGFLGSFLGAIIGGGCTCWAVIKQKEYSDRQKREDEIAQIRPFIVAIDPEWVESGANLAISFCIKNIGLNSAHDLELYSNNLELATPLNKIDSHKYCLIVGEKIKVKPKYNFNQTIYYQFCFRDLMGNIYTQEFRFSQEDNTFISFEPKKQ